ncbi:MAG: DHH family phosphoesterase [Methermicoccaceae archaeon]
MSEYHKLREWLEEICEKRLLYLCHKDADSDAIASSFALSRHFEGDIGVPDGMNRVATRLCTALNIEPIVDPPIEKYDGVLVVDSSNLTQLGNPALKRYSIIDHHSISEFSKGAEVFINEKATSTSEIVYDMLKEWRLVPEKVDVLALLVGIITDTGHLKHATSQTFKNIGKMLSDSKIQYRDALELISSTPINSSLKREILNSASRMEVIDVNNRLIVFSVTTENTDSVASSLIKLGADIALVGMQSGERVKLSIRARHQVLKSYQNLGELMKSLGGDIGGEGGGHRAAAGLELSGELNHAMEQCKDYLIKWVE